MTQEHKHGKMVRGMDQDFSLAEANGRAGRNNASNAAFRPDLRRAYSLHRRPAWIAGFSVFLLVLLYGATRPKQYEASEVFYVAPVQREVLMANGSQGYDDARYNATLQQLIETIERPDVAEKAVATLPEGVWRKKNESVRSAAARLAGSVSAKRAGISFELVATLQGSDAEGTAAALNALGKVFIEQVHAETTGPTDQQVELLNTEKDNVTESLVKLRTDQAQLSAQLGVAQLNSSEVNPFDQSISQLRQQIFALEQSPQYPQSMNSGGDSGGGNSSTSNLINSLSGRKAQLQSQMAGMTPANPIYQQDQAELAITEKTLAAANERYEKENVERDDRRQKAADERTHRLENDLKSQLARQTETAAKAAPQLQQYAMLSSEIDRLQARSNAIDEAIRSLELERRAPAQVRVAVAATTPYAPVPGKRKLIIMSSIPLGILAVIFTALLLNWKDRRIFLGQDVEQVLGFTPMAVLPAFNEVSAPVNSSYFLRLAGAVENAYRHSGARTFVFTAPNAETEVESLVYRLQERLKDMGYSALWIDSETLLRAEKDFEEAYGRGPSLGEDARFSERGTDSLAAARLAWLQRDYDMVLVDAPPITCSGEAEYAVRRCDATILVTESGVTTRDDIQLAGEILERIGMGGIGAVVTDLKLENADPIFVKAVREAEADYARRVSREPRDNDGMWQVLDAGTTNELVLPGDPVARSRRRRQPKRKEDEVFTHTR